MKIPEERRTPLGNGIILAWLLALALLFALVRWPVPDVYLARPLEETEPVLETGLKILFTTSTSSITNRP